jgi:glycosyltransferase involved in cell wall biosynthesis
VRVAYLCTDFGVPVHGAKGASIHVRGLSQALADLGHEIVIFASRAGGGAPPGFTVPVRELPLAPVARAICDMLRSDPAAGEGMAQALRSVLHVTDVQQRILPELARFAPDLLYERYSLFGTAGLALARALGRPWILEVNAPLADEHAAHRGLALADIARGVERLVLGSADRLIAVSRELESWLAGLGVPRHRISIRANGVDVARFAAPPGAADAIRRRLGLGDAPVVGFLGTLKPWHGTGTLVRAVAMLHRQGLMPRLLLVGDGPQRTQLEALAASEGVADATVFTGAIPHELVPSYLAAMTVAVVPYDQTERFYFSPLKLYECMAAGLPVVAADVGDIGECVRHGASGWLYPPGDAAALAQGMEALFARPSLAASLCSAGREHVRRHHTWLGNARAVIACARAVLPDGGQ